MTDAPRPADQWVVQLYDDLRVLAHAQLRLERTGHTLSTTGLVNEAYLRLAPQHSLDGLERAEFFNAASATMRRVLVDCARARLRSKRGGGAETVPLEDVEEFLSVRWRLGEAPMRCVFSGRLLKPIPMLTA